MPDEEKKSLNNVYQYYLLSNDSYTYFRSNSEFVDVSSEHGTTGEYTGVCRRHHCRRDRAKTLKLISTDMISSQIYVSF